MHLGSSSARYCSRRWSPRPSKQGPRRAQSRCRCYPYLLGTGYHALLTSIGQELLALAIKQYTARRTYRGPEQPAHEYSQKLLVVT